MIVHSYDSLPEGKSCSWISMDVSASGLLRHPNLPSSKLTVGPWQKTGLEDEFPLKIGGFQGQQC